ncbi:MAG: NAD+ synthase [Actinobacteria bacterium]|nr:NAD+ synthase [Actinomycetota bacterium]
MTRLRVAVCQIDQVVGDLEGNARRIEESLAIAERSGADLALFPELAVTGYPPEDLLLKTGFVADNLAIAQKLAALTGKTRAVFGFIDAGESGELYNAAAMCGGGSVLAVHHKRLLPNYGVFDEQRYFTPGAGDPPVVQIGDLCVGMAICEDVWSSAGPVGAMVRRGAELVVVINASPYSMGRLAERVSVVAERAVQEHCPLVYVNLVGGQDELVFDGGSFALDATGSVVHRAARFVEEVVIWDLSLSVTGAAGGGEGTYTKVAWRADPAVRLLPTACEDPEEEVFCALVTGTRDYVLKNQFTDVVIGLSGGIDSSLVAVIAVAALGPEHVHGVAMPSRYSSDGSITDAAELAGHLGIDLLQIPIERAHSAFSQMLEEPLGGPPTGLTEENLQSRIRGVILMSLSNSRGWMVLTTGNKSELATGYSTLYGDTAGGFAVLKDVPKTLVYDLARSINRWAERDLIPQSVLEKPPSAELRPGQRDDQSLPAYEVLDPVLDAYVEQDMTVAQIVDSGVDPELACKVARLVDRAEYKRRQTPPGVRVTPKAFGKDRRVPITNRYLSRGEQEPQRPLRKSR